MGNNPEQIVLAGMDEKWLDKVLEIRVQVVILPERPLPGAYSSMNMLIEFEAIKLNFFDQWIALVITNNEQKSCFFGHKIFGQNDALCINRVVPITCVSRGQQMLNMLE